VRDLFVNYLQRSVPLSGATARIRIGTEYEFRIQAGSIVYLANCLSKKPNYDPAIAKNDSVEFRLRGKTLYVRRAERSDLRLLLITRAQLKTDSSGSPETQTVEPLPPFSSGESLPDCR